MDTAVRAQIQVTGASAAIAEVVSFREAVASVRGQQAMAVLGVDTSALRAAQNDVMGLANAHQALGGKSVALGVDASALKAAEGNVASLGGTYQALGNKTVALGMDYSQVTSARTAVQGLDGDIAAMTSSLSKLAAPAAFAGIGLGVTKLASDFSTMTTNIRNNTTETDADFQAMTSSIKTLSADSGASLDSLGNGFMHAFNLTGSATAATNDLSVAMRSARSTGGDVNATTEALAKTMHQFGIANGDAAKTMDTLHQSSAMGNTTLSQFVDSSAKSMVTASSLGISLRDVSAAYVGLTKSGFDAGEANTQLAALMTHIINPTAAAKKEIADLSRTTGVDLVSDFSLAGVQSKGLVGVLSDLRTATGGQEDAILKLIPAQRGGIGALALTTSAYKDVIDASGQLARVQSGELTPTADAYARTQETLGFKVSVLGQEFKQLGIEAGGVAIGPLAALMGVVGSLPQGVDKAIVSFGLIALGVKAVASGADMVAAGAGRLVTAFASEAAATATDTAALEANTAALSVNAAKRDAAALAQMTGTEGYAARSAAAQTGTDATGMAGYAARSEAQVASGAVRGTESIAAQAGAAFSALTAPEVLIPVAITFGVGRFIIQPWVDSVRAEALKLQETKIDLTVDTTVRYAQSADSRNQSRADLESQLADAKKMQQQFEDLAKTGLTGTQGTAAVDYWKGVQANISKALTDTSPEHFATQATDEYAAHLKDLTGAVENNRLTLEQATHFADEYRAEAIATGAGVDQATASEKAWAAALLNSRDASYEKQYADAQRQQGERDKAKKLLDEGAPPALVETAVFGKGLGMDPATLVQQEAELASWEKTYAAETAAKKQAIQSQLTTDKAAAKESADAQIQAATDTETAWKSAASATNAFDKKLDGTAALASLSGAAEQLKSIQQTLSSSGQSAPSFSALVTIAEKFKGITDAENQAKDAYNGYMLTMSESDKNVQFLDAQKKKLDELVAAAKDAQSKGVATPEQNQLLGSASNIYGNIAESKAKLQANETGDFLGIAKNFPDVVTTDNKMRDMVTMAGGGAKMLLNVQTNADAAQAEIKDKLLGSKQALLTIKSNATEVQADLDKAAKDREAHLKVHVDYVDPQGRSVVPPGSSGGAPSTAGDPSAAASDQSNLNQAGGAAGGFTPINYADYQKVLAQYPGSPIADQGSFNTLESVAQQSGVDPRTLMAIMQTESGYGANAGAIGRQYNYGGMGVNDRGFGHDSGVQATDGGPEYAGYNDFKSFVMDIAAWVKQNGSSFSNYQTADGGQAKNATIAQLQAALPAAGSYVPPAGAQTGGGPNGNGFLTPTGSGGVVAEGTDGGVVASVRQQIVNKALASVDTDHLANLCETFVEETVQAIMGQRGATGKNEPNASQGFRDAQAKGLETKTPQKGDLVYYPNNGDGHVAIYAGDGQQVSTADRSEQGKEGLVHVENVGANARYIRVPGLADDPTGSGAGAAAGIGPNKNFADNPPSAPYVQTAAGVEKAPLDDPARDPKIPKIYDGTAQARILTGNLQGLDSVGIGQVDSAMGRFGGYATKMYEDLFNNPNHPLSKEGQASVDAFRQRERQYQYSQLPNQATDLQKAQADKKVNEATTTYDTSTRKDEADRTAHEATLNFGIAWSKALSDITNHTGNIAADYEKISETGGPLAKNAIQYLQYQQKINDATDINLKAKAEIASIDANAAARQDTRAAQDLQIAADARTLSRANQDQDIAIAAAARDRSRANEDADTALAATKLARDRGIENANLRVADSFAARQRAITIATTTENLAYTDTQRQEQDKQRALQFSQQVQGTDLQNKLTDTQKAQQSAIWQSTSAEQVQQAAVRVAPTNAGAAQAAATLAGMHDRDLAVKDENTKQIDLIQLQIREQSKAANLASYNLQTETIQKQRDHEKVMANLTAESQALSFEQQDTAKRQAAAALTLRRSDEDAALRLAAQRRAVTRGFEDDATRLAAQRLAVTRGFEDAATRLAAQRKQEDDLDKDRKKALNDTITANDKLIAGWQKDQQALDSIMSSVITQLNQGLNISAAAIASATGKPNTQQPVPLPGTPDPFPSSALTGANAVHRLGSHAAGGVIGSDEAALVGDAPGGMVTPYSEIVTAPGWTVTPISSLHPPQERGGGDTVIHMPVTLHAESISDRQIEDLTRQFNAKLRELQRSLGSAGNNAMRARGIA